MAELLDNAKVGWTLFQTCASGWKTKELGFVITIKLQNILQASCVAVDARVDVGSALWWWFSAPTWAVSEQQETRMMRTRTRRRPPSEAATAVVTGTRPGSMWLGLCWGLSVLAGRAHPSWLLRTSFCAWHGHVMRLTLPQDVTSQMCGNMEIARHGHTYCSVLCKVRLAAK